MPLAGMVESKVAGKLKASFAAGRRYLRFLAVDDGGGLGTPPVADDATR